MKKVFFDTNFLLRFYLDDIPTQALKAKRMVQAAKEGAILLVTDLVVICEIVWVMDSFYNLEKEVISEKITKFISDTRCCCIQRCYLAGCPINIYY